MLLRLLRLLRLLLLLLLLLLSLLPPFMPLPLLPLPLLPLFMLPLFMLLLQLPLFLKPSPLRLMLLLRSEKGRGLLPDRMVAAVFSLAFPRPRLRRPGGLVGRFSGMLQHRRDGRAASQPCGRRKRRQHRNPVAWFGGLHWGRKGAAQRGLWECATGRIHLKECLSLLNTRPYLAQLLAHLLTRIPPILTLGNLHAVSPS